MSANKPFVAQVDLTLTEKLRNDLLGKGFTLAVPPYTLFCAKGKDVSCTLYQSGKCVVQGKQMAEFIEFYFEPEILGSLAYTARETNAVAVADTRPRIGIDESGKGDVFGPLCVAGVYVAGEDEIAALVKLGVCDSKALNDKAILAMAPKIEQLCAHAYVLMSPVRYNELYASFRNLNQLLAWGHATAIEQLVEQTQCRCVIVDQFAYEHVVQNALKRKKLDVQLTQRHRAEEDIVVAAASVLARYQFLCGLNALSRKYGVTLPKGAAPQVIVAGRQFVREHGREALPQVAKMHFKTIDAIVS